MPLVAPVKTKDLIKPGNYVARCISMIQVGTVIDQNFGGEKHVIRVKWELPTNTKVFNPEKGEQPYVYDREYNFVMSNKANLRKDLESWRGKKFTEDEAKTFDITKLVGATCMINIVITTSKNGNDRNEHTAITPIPKGMKCPAQINPSFVFAYSDFENKPIELEKTLESIPEWLRNQIKSTKEYKKAMGLIKDEPEQQEEHVTSEAGEDDLPF